MPLIEYGFFHSSRGGRANLQPVLILQIPGEAVRPQVPFGRHRVAHELSLIIPDSVCREGRRVTRRESWEVAPIAHTLDGASRERIRMPLVPHFRRAERGVPLTHMPDGLFLVCRKPVVRSRRASRLIGECVAHRLSGAPMELRQITATNPIRR
jgi:hypothetical protein